MIPRYDSTVYLVKRLMRDYILPYKKKIAFAVSCMLVVAATTALIAWLLEPATNKIFLERDYTMLFFLPFVILVTFFVKGLASYGQTVTMGYLGQRIVTNVQVQLYEHLLHSDLATITRESSGKIISRFTNDINIMRNSVSKVFTSIAREFLTLVFLVSLMFYQSFVLAMIAFIIFPTAIYPIIRLGRRMRKVSNSIQQELGHFTARLDETFQGVRIIRAYKQEDTEATRARQVVDRLLALYLKAARIESLSSPIMETLAGVAVAGVLGYGGFQVYAGHTTAGAFTSFIAAFVLAYRPLKSLSTLNTSLQEGLAAARRVFILLDTKPLITDKDNAVTLASPEGHLRFDDVYFSYTGKKPALNGINLDVPAGKTVALVGSSGSGKSTIMNLILRFYDPERGVISLDGKSLQDIKLESLRDAVAIVSQETFLFDDSVAGNIGYGRQSASREDIIKAAKAAYADEFITELPQGYDTIIGQQGFTLSGGQRQRISIARAMLKNAPILLLDEATSALDSVSEKKVQEAMTVLMKGRTTLVIAHRLTTVMHADIIYVLRHGKVAESGTHQELLEKKGDYLKLYKGLE